jgi:hypothetical protein
MRCRQAASIGWVVVTLPAARARIAAFARRVAFIYRNSWQVFCRHWPALLGAALVVFTPAAVLEALSDYGAALGLEDAPLGALLVGLASAAVNLLAYQMFKGVTTAASMQWRGKAPARSIWHVFATLSYGTLVAVDLILTAGTGLGFLLLVVPGIVFGTWFSLAPVLVELEGRGVRAAFRRSLELVRGSFLIAVTLFSITTAVIYGLEEGIKGALQAYLDGLWHREVFDGAVAALVASVLFKPISALATVELAQELIAQQSKPQS